MAATIKDVARKANVSTATVSRVINRDNRIAPATRQRVLEAIASLSYRVNPIARSLKSNRTLSVGFIAPEIANEFFMRVAEGVELTLRDKGYNMILCGTNESVAEEEERIEFLLEKHIDGLIVIPSSSRGDHIAGALAGRSVPAVLVDRLVEGFETDAVLVDNTTGTYRAIHNLLRRGHSSFGFIGGDLQLTPARERYEGFLSALREFGVEIPERNVRFGDFHVESGYNLLGELLRQDNPPRSIFISNYFMHIGAVRYVVEHRQSLDPGLFLASFDDMELSSVTGLASLTIAQPVSRIGQEAATLLLRRLAGTVTGAPEIRRLATELVFHEA
ncbi:MAG: LacI family DNA-binding transcriptional regulator [Spirochaetaceae bacterium]